VTRQGGWTVPVQPPAGMGQRNRNERKSKNAQNGANSHIFCPPMSVIFISRPPSGLMRGEKCRQLSLRSLPIRGGTRDEVERLAFVPSREVWDSETPVTFVPRFSTVHVRRTNAEIKPASPIDEVEGPNNVERTRRTGCLTQGIPGYRVTWPRIMMPSVSKPSGIDDNLISIFSELFHAGYNVQQNQTNAQPSAMRVARVNVSTDAPATPTVQSPDAAARQCCTGLPPRPVQTSAED